MRSDFSFNVVAGHSSTTTPILLPRRRRLVLAGGLAAAVGVAAVAVVEPGAVPDARPGARDRALRDRGAARASARSSPAAACSPQTRSRRLEPAPIEGAGLNPLLRHPRMMIHPPMLYSGYTLFTIPFAFAVGALVARRLGAEWIAVDAPVRARPPGCFSASGSCSARAGPTPSSAGAATGPGTRSRTPR